jgi:hypothetical protein
MSKNGSSTLRCFLVHTSTGSLATAARIMSVPAGGGITVEDQEQVGAVGLGRIAAKSTAMKSTAMFWHFHL